MVQWKLPSSLSQFIQRAGRAARSHGRSGIAILLVEKAAYSIDTETSAEASGAKSNAKAPKPGGRRKNWKRAGAAKVPRGYAKRHGVDRGGTKKLDAVTPGGSAQPPLDPDAVDEGLLVFVQTTCCRRRIWTSVYQSAMRGNTTALFSHGLF